MRASLSIFMLAGPPRWPAGGANARALIAGGAQTQGVLTVRGACELIEAGVKLLGDMRDAFGTSAIDQAIWDASPFLARKMHLPEI